MNILSAEGISKSYSEKILFGDISISISEGEKIGLIGINGTGKSTLLKVLAGIETSDSGKIMKASGLKIQYLPQNPIFESGLKVIEQVFKGDTPVMKLLREYEETLQSYNKSPGEPELEKKLLSLTQKMDSLDAWGIESEAKNILTKLGIWDFDAEVGTLSGGQKKRIAMASAFITPADLLILDEPTNHIDSETVNWLENYLSKRKGALLMVTHDRYFLDRIANRIIELDKGKLYSYQANYTKFLEMKTEREELEQSSERKRQSLLRSELAWMRQGAQARSTKQKARIERFEKLQAAEPLAGSDQIEIRVGASRLGRKIIEASHIYKSYSEETLIRDFSYILLRDDRIGIIGPNGTGKTTLLKILGGRLQPDQGKVETGETVKIGFFSQETDEMKEELRVIEYIKEEAEFLTTKEGTISASQMLERFLFPPQVQWTPISKLSGGEKRRLFLLRILMGAPNILMLDEPTNDLDIQTLTILESYLDEFPGAVLVVSHDRFFLDRVADRIFSFEGEGKIQQYAGNYSDYDQFKLKTGNIETKEPNKGAPEKETTPSGQKKDRPLKFTFKEQREFETIEVVIGELESELRNIDVEMGNVTSDFERLQQLIRSKEELEGKLDEAMERWTYLNEIAEEIERAKKEKS